MNLISFDLDELNQFGNDSECREMRNKVYGVNGEFVQLLETKKAAKGESKEVERQRLASELKEAKALNRQLEGEQGSLYIENAAIDAAVQNTYRQLREYRRDYSPNEIMALPADIEAFNETVAKLEAAYEEAQAAQREYNSRVGSWRGRMNASNQRVQQLTDQVNQAWRTIQRLQGKKVPPMFDRATGLPVPAVDNPIEIVPVGPNYT